MDSYTSMYYIGRENGQSVVVLIIVVLFWDSRIANMLMFHNFTYYVEFENGQHFDVLVFVIVFGIREWSGC